MSSGERIPGCIYSLRLLSSAKHHSSKHISTISESHKTTPNSPSLPLWMNRHALLLYLQSHTNQARGDERPLLVRSPCRLSVHSVVDAKGLSTTHNRSRTHNEILVVSTRIRLVCSDMDRRGVVVLDDVLEVLRGDFSSRKATHPSSPSPADCPSGSHEEDDLLAAIFMMRAPPSRSSNGRPRRSAPSCAASPAGVPCSTRG